MAKRTLLKRGDKVLNGEYEIREIIHSAGMSNVYMAVDVVLNTSWCIKEIRKSEAGRDEIEYHSILQEANIMKKLSHNSIPRIITIKPEGDSIFIVMDYIEGISLKSYVSKNGALNESMTVKIMRQIADVMLYLHSMKNPIFYRDMKPDNIMVKRDNNISLIDFGISVVVSEDNKIIKKNLGTRGYCPKEQSKRGLPYDLRSDIYAMGKTMYFMLTGIDPALVPKDKLPDISEIVPDLSRGLRIILEKCIQEEVEDRYQNCEELIYDLKNYKNFDETHIKKLKDRIKLTTGMFITSIVLIGGSFIPLGLHKKSENEVYNNLVAIATQSGKVEDYQAVFDVDPLSDISLYLGYIKAIKLDGDFSKEEEYAILNYINPNIQEFSSKEGYGEFAYEFGKLYWFYYQGSSDNEGMISSVKWFEDAMNAGYLVDSAEVYYKLGKFNRDILASIAESEDSGMYSEYWNNLLSAKSVETGELVRLQLYSSIAKCIMNYGYSLKKEGVTQQEIDSEVSELEDFTKTYIPNGSVATEKFNNLKNSISSVKEMVNSLYRNGGEE